MYNLPYHKEHDEEVIKEFLAKYPFAYLSGCDAENNPIATQLPLFVEERNGKKLLSGHLMKNTDHHKAFSQNESVLAIFTGKHTYVSATWYSDPHKASTWNYMSVHMKGIIRFLGHTQLEEVIQKTSLHFEGYNKESPTVYKNLPEVFKKRVMHAIVAFEIEVNEIDTVFKLSQDRDEESYHSIIHELKKGSADAKAIATEMEKRAGNPFSD